MTETILLITVTALWLINMRVANAWRRAHEAGKAYAEALKETARQRDAYIENLHALVAEQKEMIELLTRPS